MGKSIIDAMRKNLNDLTDIFHKAGNDSAHTLVFAILKDMVDQEAGQRGYLITGREEFLDPYHQGATYFNQHIEELRAIVDNAYHKEEVLKELETLREYMGLWHSEAADKEIQARREINIVERTPFEFLQSFMSNDAGKARLAKILQSITVLQQRLWGLGFFKAALISTEIKHAILTQESEVKNFIGSGDEKYLQRYNDQHSDYQKSYIELSLELIQTPEDDRMELVSALSGLQNEIENWRRDFLEPQIFARKNFKGQGLNTISQIQNEVRRATGKSMLDDMRVILDRIRADFQQAQNLNGINAVLRVAKNLVDQETGQRGFLITGEDSFLQPYWEGQKGLLQSLAELRNIASEAFDVEQLLIEIAEVEALAAQWINVSAEPEIAIRRNINVQKENYVTIEEVIAAGKGKAVLDQVRFKLEQIDRKFSKASHKAAQRLLVAIAHAIVEQETGQKGYLITGREEFLQPYKSGQLALASHFKQLNELVKSGYDSEAMLQKIDSLRIKSEQWIVEAGEPEIALRRKINETGATMNDVTVLIENETGKKLMDELRNKIDEFVAEENRLIDVRSLEAERASERMVFLVVFGTLVSISVALLSAIIVSRSIVGAVKKLSLATQGVAAGDFSQLVETPSNDEIGELADAFNDMIKQLRNSKEVEDISSAELHAQAERLSIQKTYIEQQNLDLVDSQKDLEQKAEELNRSSKYKSEFLANMSHELRTPLNSLLILSKHLTENKKGNLDESQVECASIIYDGGQDLLNIITDILDLSKVEAGMLSLHVENVGVEQTFLRLKQQFTPVAENKELRLIFENTSGIDLIKTDNQRLHQILKNFLSNAFKFTKQGQVTVTAFKPGEQFKVQCEQLQGIPCIGFAVKDSGIGIREDKKHLIFESFQQADGSTSRQYGGTGLGLTISRELAAFLGGEIQLESSEGEGSTFVVLLPEVLVLEEGEAQSEEYVQSLPETPARSQVQNKGPQQDQNRDRQRAEQKDLPKAQAFAETTMDVEDKIGGSGSSILIIEDDPVFNKVLTNLARGNGFNCLSARDGEEGLSLALKYQPLGILLDMSLPDMDGLEVLEKLKSNSSTSAIPVEVITGRQIDSKIMRGGAVGVIQKPGAEEEIISVLKRFGEAYRRTINKILVVEDELVGQQALRLLLQDVGMEVDCVATGADAIQAVLNWEYDCMILDLGLPDISGLDVLQRLGDNLPTLLPVVVYTGREICEKEQQQLDQYALNVIKKESSFANLLTAVNAFLNSIHRDGANHAVSDTSTDRSLELTHVIQEEHSFQQLGPQPLSPQPHDLQEHELKTHCDDAVCLQDRKVLLVDDDVRNLFSLSKVLQDEGMQVVIAENGQIALDKLAAIENEDVEIVLMDIMMPVMDGYEAIQRIRELEYTANIPIIAVTANAMLEDRQKCIDCGASDYLSKPVEAELLFSTLKLCLFKYGALERGPSSRVGSDRSG